MFDLHCHCELCIFVLSEEIKSITMKTIDVNLTSNVFLLTSFNSSAKYNCNYDNDYNDNDNYYFDNNNS